MDKRRVRLSDALAAAVLSAMLSVSLAGCGSSTAPPGAAEGPYVPPEASDTPTIDAAEELMPDGPLFLPLGKWQPAPTNERQLNPCLQQRLVVLGAETTRYRSFHATYKNAEGQDLVAVFHDRAGARQAAYLLRRWQETCADRLDDRSITASTPRSVGPGRGNASWFVTYAKGRTGEDTRWSTGLVQVGRLVGVVTVQETTSDTDPTSVEAPLVRMVERGFSRLA